jgi:hypothetical protein
MTTTKITKYAYEEFYRYHDFARSDGRGKITTGETVSTCTVTVTDDAGADVSASMVSDVSAYGSPQTQVKYLLKGGTAGETYTITIRGVTSNSQKFEDHLTLEILT